MSDELVAFVEARLAEDEAAARKAASLCGCHPPAPVWHFDDEGTDGRILIEDDPHAGTDASPTRLRKRWNGSYQNLFAAQHIARHDPSRVLRDVEATRRLLDAIFRYEAKIDGELGCCHSAEAIRGGACSESGDIEALRLLALPYADHPGFRSEWLIEENSTDE